MPEPQLRPGRGQQAGFSQPIHHLWRAGGGPLKQPRLDRGTDQCRDIEHVERLRPESRGPGQHRVAGGGRYPVQPGLQHLRDVERVSAGGLVQLGGIQAAVPGHDRHGPRRQREEFDPPGTSLHRELPESHPQRVAHRQLILPVRSHDQDRELADPPGQEPQQVQGRLVGPVDVLDDDHAKPALCTELTQQGREQIVPRTLHPAQPGQIAAELAAEVKERS